MTGSPRRWCDAGLELPRLAGLFQLRHVERVGHAEALVCTQYGVRHAPLLGEHGCVDMRLGSVRGCRGATESAVFAVEFVAQYQREVPCVDGVAAPVSRERWLAGLPGVVTANTPRAAHAVRGLDEREACRSRQGAEDGDLRDGEYRVPDGGEVAARDGCCLRCWVRWHVESSRVVNGRIHGLTASLPVNALRGGQIAPGETSVPTAMLRLERAVRVEGIPAVQTGQQPTIATRAPVGA